MLIVPQQVWKQMPRNVDVCSLSKRESCKSRGIHSLQPVDFPSHDNDNWASMHG